jgi:hypothetical protein
VKGAIVLYSAYTGSQWITDIVGWAPSSGPIAPIGERSPYIQDGQGLNEGGTHVRYSMPGAYYANKGNAFDSDNNTANFLKNADISLASDTYPRNSSSTYSAVPVSGYPVNGAVISCDDGLSSYTTSYQVDYSGNNLSYFVLPNVATGTWNVSVFYSGTDQWGRISSGYQEYSNVRLFSSGQIVGVPNSTTTPVWPYTGSCSVVLSSAPSYGHVSGIVRSGGSPLSTSIKVIAGSKSAFSRSDGRYSLAVDSGTITVTSNPGNINPSYVEQNIENVVVSAGQITSGIDFDLSPGGIVTGKVRSNSGDNLPNIVLVAYDKNTNEASSAVSGSDGIYRIANLPTTGNPYLVKPIIDSIETSSPDSVSGIAVVQGTSVSIATFTITSAYGYISGSVTENGRSINTGVLLIASTGTISSDPPVIDSTLRGGAPYYYGTVSQSNGAYTLQVRGGNIYNVYAWYTTMSAGGVSSTTRKPAAPSSRTVTVNQGQTVTGINFSWP